MGSHPHRAPAFLPSAPVSSSLHARSSIPFRHGVLPLSTRLSSQTRRVHPRPMPSCPVMIQRPDMDGPPDLAAFFSSDKASRANAMGEAPICVSTGRANLAGHARDAASTATDALHRAQQSSADEDAPPQLCHVTHALDVDADAAVRALRAGLPEGVAVVSRSVNKKDFEGTIEVLLLSSEATDGVVVASATADVEDDNGVAGGDAAAAVAKKAVSEAVGALGDASRCTFLIFAHSPGLDEEAVRRGIAEVSQGLIAYGGPAVGAEDGGGGWSLCTGHGEIIRQGSGKQAVVAAAVPGFINYLISSVVKNWAQPAFSEPLSFMVPRYVDDPVTDLLTAIRYDDWERFIWCVEEKGVSLNTKWTDKQNQTPLLAACSRARVRMVEYMVANGADVTHRNNGNFTAAMYTRKLTEYDSGLVLRILKALHDGGLDTRLSPEDAALVAESNGGRTFTENPDV